MSTEQTNPTTNSLSTTITSLNLAYKTQADITLSEFDTTAAPQVQAGSVFGNNGAQFSVTADETPSGYAGIANSTTFYIYYNGTNFIYAETAPTWSDDKQGWYNGNNRAFFSMYKDSGGTLYESKSLLRPPTILQTKTLEIGDWNMDTTAQVDIPHDLSDHTKIKAISILIRRDAPSDEIYDFGSQITYSTATNISAQRINAGFFDDVNFNDTSYNRGWVTITYEA